MPSETTAHVCSSKQHTVTRLPQTSPIPTSPRSLVFPVLSQIVASVAWCIDAVCCLQTQTAAVTTATQISTPAPQRCGQEHPLLPHLPRYVGGIVAIICSWFLMGWHSTIYLSSYTIEHYRLLLISSTFCSILCKFPECTITVKMLRSSPAASWFVVCLVLIGACWYQQYFHVHNTSTPTPTHSGTTAETRIFFLRLTSILPSPSHDCGNT